MFKICTLCSSSKGNCSFITDGKTNILIDCGIKIKSLEEFLSQNGYTLNDINAILITHEHIDHIYGLKNLSKKVDTPIYAYCGVQPYITQRLGINLNYRDINITEGFYIGDIFISPFTTSHDSVFPLGFTFCEGDKRASVATDLGVVSEEIRDVLLMSDAAILEANHDKKMLEQGRYSYRLKRRIAGSRGHLSNDDSGLLISRLCEGQLSKVILAHLSEENNLPELAYSTVEDCIKRNKALTEKSITIEIAPCSCASKFLEV